MGDLLDGDANALLALSINSLCLSSKLSIFKPNAHLAMISIVVALSCLKENMFLDGTSSLTNVAK